jgi:ABC-type amino acid transport substrate-binding protein
MLSQASRYSKPYRICTTPWSPIVTCEPGGDPSSFSGYQIELFNDIVRSLGWEADDWYYDCIDWSTMLEDLRAANGTCFMAASGEH